MVSLVAVLFLGLVASAAPRQTRSKGTVLASLGFPNQDVIGHDSSQLQTTKKKAPPLVIFDNATSGSNLTSVVEQEYLKPLPSSMDASQIINNVTGIQINFNNNTVDKMSEIDIVTPLMDTCRPKVSAIIPLYQGLECPSDAESCSQTVEFSTTTSYQSSLGFSFSATISVEADFVVAKTSASATFDTSYDYTWGREDESSSSYTFNLLPGGYCTPSMVHIELECDTAAHRVYYDTDFLDLPEAFHLSLLDLAETFLRTGGPYEYGQWCRYSHVSETILDQDQYWTTISVEFPYRGEMWTQLPSDLNQYKTNSSDPDITDDEVPIRRTPNSGKTSLDSTEFFVCKRTLSSEKNSKVTIPVSQGENALMGYIGCVH